MRYLSKLRLQSRTDLSETIPGDEPEIKAPHNEFRMISSEKNLLRKLRLYRADEVQLHLHKTRS